MTAIFIITSVIYFITRGLVEGIVMIRMPDVMYEVGQDPGPRCHTWFGAYHVLAVVRDINMIAAVWFASLAAVPGILLLGWELMEIAYSTSRYAQIIPSSENILGLGYTARGQALTILHTVRIMGGMLLLIVLT